MLIPITDSDTDTDVNTNVDSDADVDTDTDADIDIDSEITPCSLQKPYSSVGVFGVMYDGYLSNAEDDVEGAIPVIIKTVKGEAF